MIYLLIGYMWLFIHRPFEVWPWLAELRIERVYMLITLAYWATQPKVWMSFRSHIPVFLLATTFLLHTQLLSPYAEFASVEDWFKVFLFYVLVVTTAKTDEDLKQLVVAYVAIMAMYELHSLREYFNGRGVYRMGTWRMIGVDATKSDPNSFSASINYSLPFLYPVWGLTRVKWQKAAVVGAGVLAVGCIMLTGSRSSFAALIFLLLLITMTSVYRWRIVAALVVIPPLVWINLRPDLQERYVTLIDSSHGPENAQESAEGRAQSFWEGMQSFAENPIFGAGLGSYLARTGFQTHNLYNQAMGELGMFGLAVLVSFAWCFVANYREACQYFRPDDLKGVFLYRICLAGLLSCLLLFLLGWGGHNLARYNWLWFGAFTSLAVNLLGLRTALAVESQFAHATCNKNLQL